MGLRDDIRDFVSRALQPAEPQTYIDGGGNDSQRHFRGNDRRNTEDLARYEEIYRKGGPIAQMIDARAFMIFGTGSEFQAERDFATTIDGDTVTIEEWLDETFSKRDELFPRIARDAYVYGESDAELVPTRDNGFSHVELINPKTLEPKWNNKGEITRWEQSVKSGAMNSLEQTLDADEVAHFVLSKVGRQIGGVSLVGRAEDEINRYASNQSSRAKYLERYGNPKRHVKVGREGGAAIDDRQLKKIRARVRQLERQEDLISGWDIDVDSIDDFSADVTDATEVDLKQLAIAMGIPLELADIGGDGMGTGRPADLRLAAFERQGHAEQKMLARQFVEEVVRPVLRENSPFPADANITLEFEEIITDKSDKADWMSTAKDVLTVDEMRAEFGYAPHEGDEDELGPPQDTEPSGPFGLERANLIEGQTEQGTLFTGALGYADREAAEQKAEQLGCSGAHQMEMGDTTMWVPCNSHERFEEVKPTSTRMNAAADDGEAAVRDALKTLMDVHERVAWSEDDDRELFAFDDDEVPEFAKAWISQAIDDGALFSEIETIPDAARIRLQTTLKDSLQEQHGWSINSLRENIREEIPTLSKQEAERIARTETQAIVADAREIGYTERDMDDQRFRWVGPDDDRTTEICENIKQRSEGGVPLSELKDIVQDEGDGEREWTPHINCRHTFVRSVGERDASRALQEAIEDIDFGDYPEAAVENARMALDAREETGNPNDCGTRVGWERANQLDNGEDLSRETVARMAAFRRHQDNAEQSDEEGEADCGWMMWKAWGGEEGVSWAESKMEEVERIERDMAHDIPMGNNKFAGGDIVMFGWEEGDPTVGRIVRSDSESITIGEKTVSGESDEYVYLIELENGGWDIKAESDIRPADGDTEETAVEVE